MYQKTQDRGDYFDRVASHATKGSGRGTVWWNVPEPPKRPKRRKRRVIPDNVRLVMDQLKKERRVGGSNRAEARWVLGKIYKNLYGKRAALDGGT